MTNEAMSPLQRRMIEDMTIRKLAPKFGQDYSRPTNGPNVGDSRTLLWPASPWLWLGVTSDRITNLLETRSAGDRARTHDTEDVS